MFNYVKLALWRKCLSGIRLAFPAVVRRADLRAILIPGKSSLSLTAAGTHPGGSDPRLRSPVPATAGQGLPRPAKIS